MKGTHHNYTEQVTCDIRFKYHWKIQYLITTIKHIGRAPKSLKWMLSVGHRSGPSFISMVIGVKNLDSHSFIVQKMMNRFCKLNKIKYIHDDKLYYTYSYNNNLILRIHYMYYVFTSLRKYIMYYNFDE